MAEATSSTAKVQENNDSMSSFQGTLSVSTVRKAPANTSFKAAQLFVKVVALEEENALNRKSSAILADDSGLIKTSVSQRLYGTFKRAFTKDITLNLKDFLFAQQTLYITEYSTVLRSHQEVNVPSELRSRAPLILTKPDTVAAIKTSPVKSRVNLKGKIVKVKHMGKVRISKTNETKELVTWRVKDATGIIAASLWGRTAVTHKHLEVGACVKIERGERGVFQNQPTLNTWEDSTTIELIQDDLDITDSDDETIEQQPRPMPAGATQAEWVSVGNVALYEACTNSKCFYKKIVNGVCPSCKQSATTTTNALILTAGIRLPGTEEIKTVRMFTNIIQNIYSQIRPGISMPQSAEDIEDQLFAELPKQCSMLINANNVVTRLNIVN